MKSILKVSFALLLWGVTISSVSASSTVEVTRTHFSLKPQKLFEKDECNPDIGKLKCSNYKFSGDWTFTNFRKADLRGAVFDEGSIFRYANFTGANLSGADFRSSRQRSAPSVNEYTAGDYDYEVCSYRSCPKVVDLTGANFTDADLSKVYFGSAMLEGAKFNKAWLSKASFTAQNTNSYLNMKNTSFVDAYMEDASFYLVDLSGANFSRARISRGFFIRTVLTGSNFESAMLERASFTGAVINKTNFKGANLGKARFPSGCKPQKVALTTCK